MKKIYFIGEYGYAFRQVLPFLENYPESLEILTWEPLCKLIALLWPNKHVLHEVESFIKDLDEIGRNNTWYIIGGKTIRLEIENPEFEDISVLDPDKEYLYPGGFLKFNTLNRKIIFGEQLIKKRYVSIFPRNRKLCSYKNNISRTHINWLEKNYPDMEIVGHGLLKERIDLGIRYCKDIYEQINVLNNSEVFICPSSGLADLGLLCGCDLILTSQYLTIEKVNPHNCLIKYWDDIKK
jgi:hypothetical protein